MLSNLRRALVVVVFSAIAGVGSFVWADHGHGGWNGGHGFGGGHVSVGHFGGHSGWGNHWGGGNFWGGSGIRFYSGYRNYGWPYSYYRNYYYPYTYSYFGYPYLYGYYGYPTSYYYGYPNYYYGYPSTYFTYPSDYVNGSTDVYSDAPPREYVVSRPVADVARVEFRLPDPQAVLWVQGKEMTSSGTVRQFRSPPLDPAQQYTYTVKAQWHNNGKLFEEERQVKVQSNALAVVDFTQPTQAIADTQGPALPDLPPPRPKD